MSNTQLDALAVGQPPDVEAEIIRINTERGRSPSRWRSPSRSSPGSWASSTRSG